MNDLHARNVSVPLAFCLCPRRALFFFYLKFSSLMQSSVIIKNTGVWLMVMVYVKTYQTLELVKDV